MNKKIIFTSGGTGGHIFPAINLMKHLMDQGYEVILVTDERTFKNYFDNIFIKTYPKLKIYIVNTDTINKKKFLKNILSLLKIFISICKSIIILKKENPSIIIGFGGYVSFPVAFSSRFFNSSLILYESNLILGRANKYLLPIASKLIVSNAPPVKLPKK